MFDFDNGKRTNSGWFDVHGWESEPPPLPAHTVERDMRMAAAENLVHSLRAMFPRERPEWFGYFAYYLHAQMGINGLRLLRDALDEELAKAQAAHDEDEAQDG